MVSSRLSPLTKVNLLKPNAHLVLEFPDVIPTYPDELDFSDVFGPVVSEHSENQCMKNQL